MSAASVSVVIPTVGREELFAAIESALGQDHQVHEILVVLDSEADIASRLPADPRVKLLHVGPGGGGNVARQAGIVAATGTLIALLDDDDTWSPDKLAEQLRLVTERKPVSNRWISTSRLVARFPDHEEIWPRDLIREGERVGEYILRKHRPKGGQGFVQASTLLFPRELGLAVPFNQSLRFHQDVDWLLAVDQATPSLEVVQSAEALTIYNIGPQSLSGGSKISPRDSIEWARSRIGNDPRSLGDFILTTSVIYAARRTDPIAVAGTIWAGLRFGRPGLAAIAYSMFRLLTATGAWIRSAPRRVLETRRQPNPV